MFLALSVPLEAVYLTKSVPPYLVIVAIVRILGLQTLISFCFVRKPHKFEFRLSHANHIILITKTQFFNATLSTFFWFSLNILSTFIDLNSN